MAKNTPADNQQPPPPDQPTLAKALYTYIGETADELSFRKGDLLEIRGDLGQVWWYARRRRGGKLGYVPCNYVLLVNSEITGQDAWFEANRFQAEKLLMSPANRPGSYIIRPSSSGYYALSVKAMHKTKKCFFYVRHYKIGITSSGGYCMSPFITFISMHDLLAHYHEHADGLCCKLMEPCSREHSPLSSLSSMEVNRECIVLGEKLGTGSFSDVHLAIWNSSMSVAVKIMKPGVTEESDFLKEAQLLLKLNHPHVLEMLGVCTIDGPIYIITELMVNGSLLDFLRKDNGMMLSPADLVEMMIHIAGAMSYLESVSVVHRDLRAANSLVGEGNLVKLGDFGLARQLDTSEIYICNGNGKFPAKWTPVEAATQGRFSVKSDVWSFGILLWEIVTYGDTPYAGLSNREVMELVSRGYRMPNPNGGHVRCDQNIYHIMLECWRSSPENRPTFSRLKEVLVAYKAVYNAATQ